MESWSLNEIERLLESFSTQDPVADGRTRRQERIVQSATELFMKQGYRKTTVDEVAREAGVAKGTVYLHFKSKADLLIQAIVDEKRRYLVKLKPVLEAPPRQRLPLYVRTALVLVNEMPLMSKLLGGDREVLQVLEEIDPDLRRQSLGFQTNFMVSLLAQATGAHRWSGEELLDRARVLLGLIYSFGVIADERVRGGMSLERFGEVLADIIVYGVAGSAGSVEH